ncbi:MAG TPA: hypothetical protein VI461_06090 [Chitinophagaceae bacterium]|nr:hypothetical protein [Chitinophagaceae bacterium]
MKKMIVTLAIALSTLSSFAGEVKVSSKVLDAFQTEFATASDITWSEGSNFYKASFIFNGQHVSAFYSTEGELMGTSRYISSLDLPIGLQASLKKGYSNYWIADLFEVSNSEGTSYYITLENADSKVVLKSANGDNNWKVYQKKITKA